MAAQGAAERERAAERSAGRAGGYCWVEHAEGGSHCTLSPGHRKRHFNYYTRREFD